MRSFLVIFKKEVGVESQPKKPGDRTQPKAQEEGWIPAKNPFINCTISISKQSTKMQIEFCPYVPSLPFAISFVQLEKPDCFIFYSILSFNCSKSLFEEAANFLAFLYAQSSFVLSFYSISSLPFLLPNRSLLISCSFLISDDTFESAQLYSIWNTEAIGL